MTVDSKAFNAGLNKWLEKFNGDNTKGLRAVAGRMMENIIRRTPVGDPDYWQSRPPAGYVGGYARANWFVSLNQQNNAPRGNGSPGKPGQSVDYGTTLAQFKAGDTVYIQNGVPYILALEHGSASPRQAPAGMVNLTIEETKQFFADQFKGGLQ